MNPVVVVGVDGSPGSRAALEYALAAARQRGADLDVVSTYSINLFFLGQAPLAVPDVAAIRSQTHDAARALIEEVQHASTAPAGDRKPQIRLIVAEGQAAGTLVEQAAGAALLVVGSRGRGTVRSLVMGSVALHCISHARCPVVVVPTLDEQPADDHQATGPGRVVVVGVDGSPDSRGALTVALEEAARIGASLDVVLALQLLADTWQELSAVVVPPTVDGVAAELQSRTEQQLAELLASRDPAAAPAPPAEVTVVEGVAADVLLRRATGAALLVVGSRGLGTFRGMLLGSVALQCVVHATAPVMVVHPLATD